MNNSLIKNELEANIAFVKYPLFINSLLEKNEPNPIIFHSILI